MPKGKKRVRVEMSPAVKLAGDLLKLAEKVNKFLAPKYDTAGVRERLNGVREALSAAAEAVKLLPDTWKPGKAKTPEQIKAMKEKLAKLTAELAALDAQ